MAKFLKSAPSVEAINIDDRAVEFCFIGRSNVGKSTLINALANASIAKTSKQPGRTQLINVYDFGGYRIVDLPGYGYAQVSKEKRWEIDNLLNDYINNRTNLFCIFQICDMGVITKQDLEIYRTLQAKFKNIYIVLNKADKLTKSYFANNKIKIAKQFPTKVENLIPISASKKENIAYIKRLMNVLTKTVK